MTDQVIIEVAKSAPALVCVCIFVYGVLRMLSGALGQILAVLERLDERTRACLDRRQD